jgi:hypothetical protein
MIAGQLEIQLVADVARLANDMQKAQSAVSSAMSNIDRGIGVATKALGALGIGLSVNYFAGLIKNSIDAQDNLAKMSQRVGVSVESLNGLGHAAGLSGTSLATVEKALKTMSGGMLDAQRGLSGAKENFAALGISVTDSTGALRSADAVMIEVADKFAHMKDGTEKAAIATKLFGRAGLELIPMLNEGSAGLAAMVREGQRLNPVTEASAAQAEIFNDNLDRFNKTMSGFVTQLANSALPRLAEWTEAVVKVINVTNEQVEAQDAWLASIGTKSKSEIAQAIQRTHEEIEAKRQQLIVTEALAKSTFGYSDKLREQQRELADLESAQRVNVAQMNKLNAGYVPAIANTEELTEATEGLATVTAEEAAALEAQAKAQAEVAKKSQELVEKIAVERAQLAMTGREAAIFSAVWEAYKAGVGPDAIRVIAETTGALYDQQLAIKGAEVAEEQRQKALKEQLDDLNKIYSDAGKSAADSYEKMQDASREAAEAAIEDWQNVRQSFGEFFADMVLDGENAFDALLNSWKRTALQIVGSTLFDKGASLLGIPIPGGAGSSASSLFGTALTGIGSKFLPSLFGAGAGAGAGAAATGLTAEAYVSMMGSTMAGGGAAAGGGFLASLGSGAAALASNPITWAVLGALAIGSQLNKSTPSHNAGFLLHDLPGVASDRKFALDAFASGLTPVGFNRRTSATEAAGVADSFRAYDSSVVDIFKKAGLFSPISASAFTGLDERGLGSGIFFGSAGEEGKPGVALEAQHDLYVRQLIAALGAKLEGETLNRILSAGNASAMIAELNKAIGVTENKTDVDKAATRATDGLSDAQERLLDRLYPLRRVTREYEADLKLLEKAFGMGTQAAADAIAKLQTIYKDDFQRAGGSAPGSASTATTTTPGSAINTVAGAGSSKYTHDLIREIAGQTGGGMTLWNAYKAGELPLSLAVDALGSSAVYGWIAKNGDNFNPHGSHAGGLDYVPFNGYRAELHVGERVQTSKQARDSDQVAAEVRDLSIKFDMMHITLQAIATNTGKTGRALDEAVRNGDGSLSVVVAS